MSLADGFVSSEPVACVKLWPAAWRHRALPAGRAMVRFRHGRRGVTAGGAALVRADLEQVAQMRTTHVVLAAAHLDHNPADNRLRNLRSLCQRCHLINDRPHHLARRQKSPSPAPRAGGTCSSDRTGSDDLFLACGLGTGKNLGWRRVWA